MLIEHEFKLNEVIPGVIMDFIRLLDSSELENDSNKSRVATDPIWEQFLTTCSKVKIQNRYLAETTIKSKSKWISKSVSKARLLLKCAENDETLSNFDKFNLIIAIDNIENTDLAAINNYRKNIHLSELSIEDLNKERRKLLLELNIKKGENGYYIYSNGQPVEYYKLT